MPKFKLGKRIGAGGFGVVYEAVLEDNGLPCAMKQLQPTADAEDRQRFQREVRILAKLRHHHIVPIFAASLGANPPWFIMPKALYSLRVKLRRGCDEKDVWVIQQIAKGLSHAHSNGIVHRDLKPENVLFFEDKNGEAYAAVADFGLGRLVLHDSPSLTRTAIRVGTYEYMAPEQYKDARTATHLSDIYSLGKILYEVLTGEIPYPRLNLTKIPGRFVYIVQRACEDEPDRRYQSVDDLLRDLNTILAAENLFTKPAEDARDEIQLIIKAREFSGTAVAKLGRILVENTDDDSVLTGLLPDLPDPILESLLVHHPSMMLRALEAYDQAVSGSLPFEYCDVVADFYEKVFRWTKSDEVKRMILQRLPVLARNHNRWYVGGVFARIVANLKDPALIMTVRDVLASDKEVAQWCSDYLKKHAMPSVIRSVLKGSH